MIARIERLVLAVGNRDRILREAVRILHDSGPLYDWTGVYLLEEGKLVLHTQLGPPTPHEKISLDRGICGAAATSGETIVVPDVAADPRFLACSLRTRSEIVVPIRDGAGHVVGEIDVDSDTLNAFGEPDRVTLERCAALLSRLF